MFATIDALATESWAPRKTLRERARLDESLAPRATRPAAATYGDKFICGRSHIARQGFDSSAQSTGSPPASDEELVGAAEGT